MRNLHRDPYTVGIAVRSSTEKGTDRIPKRKPQIIERQTHRLTRTHTRTPPHKNFELSTAYRSRG